MYNGFCFTSRFSSFITAIHDLFGFESKVPVVVLSTGQHVPGNKLVRGNLWNI